MFTLLIVSFLWLAIVYGFSKLLLVDPRGWLQLGVFMLRFAVWALGFFIIVWVAPGVPL